MAEVLVIIPTYNERETVESIIDRVATAVPEADILVADDASPDGTGGIVDAIAARNPHVLVLHRAAKEGLGQAYLAGFEYALEEGYGYIVEIDADGSHDPTELPAMINLAKGGADLVIGSRWVDGGRVQNWPRIRQAISRSGNRYARIALKSHIHDITAGYRVFRSQTLRSLDLAGVSSQGYCFQVEMAWRVERAGKTVIEHPITFVDRAYGASKMHAGIVAEALLRVTAWGFTTHFARRNSRRDATRTVRSENG